MSNYQVTSNTGVKILLSGPSYGPQGPQGIQGVQGIQGPVGPTGPQGPPSVAPDATTFSKGILQLTNDLGGTATSPQVVSTHLSSPLPILQGGTGQSTQQAAIDVLTGTQSSGKYLRSDGIHATLSSLQAGDIPNLVESQITNLVSDLAAKATDSLVVHLSGTETITGIKTFNAGTLLDKGNQFFNVKAFGVKGDGIILTDGAMTSGSATLTSASASFTANDVGKLVTVNGAGNQSTHSTAQILVTTISAYISATQVTLAANAVNTVSGARVVYGTDDKTNVQTAYNTAGSNCAVFFPSGIYLYSNTVQPKYSNVITLGSGRGSTIFMVCGDQTVGGAKATIFFNNPDGVTPVNNVSVKDVSIDMNHFAGNGLAWWGTTTGTSLSSGCLLERVEVYNRGADSTGSTAPLQFQGVYSGVNGGVTKITFRDVYIHDADAVTSTYNSGYSILFLSNGVSQVTFDNVYFNKTQGSTIACAASGTSTRSDWKLDKVSFIDTIGSSGQLGVSYGDFHDTNRTPIYGIKFSDIRFEQTTNHWVFADQVWCILLYDSTNIQINNATAINFRSFIAPGISSPTSNEDVSFELSDSLLYKGFQLADSDGHFAAKYTNNIFYRLTRGALLGGYGRHYPTVYDGNLLVNCCTAPDTGQEYYQGIFLIEDGGNTVQNNVIYTDTPLSTPGAPAVAINAVAGNLNGAYTYKITFLTDNDGETDGGTTSASVSPINQKVNLTSIPLGGTGCTMRKIYRTAAGGADGTQKLVATITDNTTTTYTDNIADSALGAAVPTVNTTLTGMKYVFCENYGGVYNAYPNQYKNNTILGYGATSKSFYLDSGFGHIIQGNTGITEATIQNSLASGSPSVTSLASSDIASRNWLTNGTLVTENSPLPISGGGTGQTTKSAAFNALSPMTTAGDLIYGGASGAGTRLAAGTSSQVLIGGTTPSWGAVALGSMVSGTLGVTNGGSGTSTSFTQGSVLFAGASGVYSQDNTKLFWDDTNFRLGIGTGAPLYPLDVVGSGPSIYLRYTSAPTSSARLFADSFNLSFQSNSGTDTSPTWTTGLKLGLSGSGIGTGNASLPTANATLYLGATNSGYFVIERGQTAGGSSTDLYIGESSDTGHLFVRGTNGITLSNGPLNINAQNIVTDTSTGTKIGTSTSQKLAFYNSTPIVQPSGNILTALSNLGLISSPTLPGSSLTNSVVTKTANYTVTSTDNIILGDTTSGGFTLTLPTAVGVSGQVYIIKKIAAANTLTVATTSSQTIDGSTSAAITVNNTSLTLVSDNTNWRVI